MRNNKGMTIVEIIVSITLVSIVLVFMLNLLITVKNFQNQSQNVSDLLINQALLTREIENDFKDYVLKGVSVCDDSDFAKTGYLRPIPSSMSKSDGSIYCLKLIYDETLVNDNIGYLVQYNFDSNSGVIGYKRSSNQVLRQTSYISNSYSGSVVSSCSSSSGSVDCSLKITLPVIGNDDNNYDVVLTYIYKHDDFTCTSANSYRFKITC